MLLNATCRVAENGVGLIATTTKPIVDRYQLQSKFRFLKGSRSLSDG